MFQMYQPFVLKKIADGRIFFINGQMPFEFFLNCFQTEQPFFMVWQLDNGRIGIMPNTWFIPPSFSYSSFAHENLLPSDTEYVTLNHCPYPVMITAHPVTNVEVWLRKFERCVTGFGKQPVATFFASFYDVKPLKFEKAISGRGETVETPI